MIENQFSKDETIYISKQIKNPSEETIKNEMLQLISIGDKAGEQSSRSRIGNNIVDYFTFTERLNTKGKYDLNFYDFVTNIDALKEKKFISNMLLYYKEEKNKNNTKNEYIVLKEVYNICISAINIYRPLGSMEIYSKYKPTAVLDFCAGWGGRLVGAAALNLESYTGIDINTNLEKGYDDMKTFLKEYSNTNINMYFEDAVEFDYSKINYDMVFTSPPYYFLEKYQNNNKYISKRDMNTKFYGPLIEKTFKHLKLGGVYCLNVNQEIYENVCVKLLGESNDKITLKKSKRQNNYCEYVHVWRKN